MPPRAPLYLDPIAEAKRQWIDRGWGDAALGMTTITSVTRAQQLLIAPIEAALRPFDLSFARFELLRLLAFTKEGTLPMTSTVARLQVHPATVTSAAGRLEAAGLLVRQRHPADGRATLLTITALGRERVEAATQVLNDEVFSKLPIDRDDATELVRIIARFRRDAGDFIDPPVAPDPL